KTGGLGDVSRALPDALRAQGHDVRICMPGYPTALERMTAPVAQPAITVPWPSGARLVEMVLDDRTDAAPAVFFLDVGFDTARPYHDDMRDHFAAARRFALFSRAVATYARAWGADVIHLNDWQTGLVPVYGLVDGAIPPTVFAIHNLAYQGNIPFELLPQIGVPPAFMRTENGVEFFGAASLMKAGIALSDRLVTVSPTYSREIQTPEYGNGLDGLLRFRRNVLHGILNGIDVDAWNPRNDTLIEATYHGGSLKRKGLNRAALVSELALEPERPVIAMVTRLAHQKGIDMALAAIPAIIGAGASLAVLGDGDAGYEHAFAGAAAALPGRVAARFVFDEGLAHRLYAGGDFFLMPSLYEPCGLGQMIAQRYGTPPIVRSTGGLADTVEDGINGFAFDSPSTGALAHAVSRALAHWNAKGWTALRQQCMRIDHSWNSSAAEYERLYEAATAARAASV
ncbi:MAG: glycogen synthase, partial [Longimicrobiales bacterium]